MTHISFKKRTAVKSIGSVGASLAAAVLLLSACGSDNNATTASGHKPGITCETGSVAGAGSTFAQNIVQQWIKDYSGACSGATVNYQGVGSGAGIQQFTSGTVDFAGSDVALKAEERIAAEAKVGKVLQIPWSAGGIAVEYKLANVNDLKLSGETLASIFAGRIKTWDDALVKADNPGATLPSTPVQVVHRSDGSGTTAAFTAYMTAAAPSIWTSGSSKDVPWPAGQGAKGSDGVTAAVKATDGAIGYAELSFAKANSLGVAKIKNAGGAFVSPNDAGAVSAALEEATVPADLNVKINYAPKAATAYPISTVTYLITAVNPTDPQKAKLIKSFADYALGDGQNSAEGLAYAKLPSAVATPAKAAAETIGTH